MSSSAFDNFFSTLRGAEELKNAPKKVLGPRSSNKDRQFYYHASIAISVSAWDAYINNVVRDFYKITAASGGQQYVTIHNLSKDLSEQFLKKFNTPNWENSRNVLFYCTGFDPYAYWVWPSRNWSVQDVKDRLNQILRIRHSFAHGFGLPAYDWTISPRGYARLTFESTDETEKFFKNLVRQTEKGLQSYTNLVVGAPIWP